MERCDLKCKEILRKEYSDYDKNSWHYEREFGMLLKAYKEGAEEIHDLVREKLLSNENSGLNIPPVIKSVCPTCKDEHTRTDYNGYCSPWCYTYRQTVL